MGTCLLILQKREVCVHEMADGRLKVLAFIWGMVESAVLERQVDNLVKLGIFEILIINMITKNMY